MSVCQILAAERVSVASEGQGAVATKQQALERLAHLLAGACGGAEQDEILRVLSERERLQSTGVGGGVAVPHGALSGLDRQVGAMLLCPQPIEFDAVDGQPVAILFALVAPKGAPAEHLKLLARVSRLLREPSFRERLRAAPSGEDAYRVICAAEQAVAAEK